ncbi:MAG: tRNA epoxyqueuosine(34) reductase QueG [Bacteroidales bacterium]|nr:tRNA epoxyqueuosine(34) reductase QueG [Bacteroidales bacterium]MDD3891680.1 tRNA epoxyqueuosine(34) reductase QueG [Bacteroidales bacterium]
MIIPLKIVETLAKHVGFDAYGVSSAGELTESINPFNRWISSGMNGEMGYMERNADKRLDPTILVPNAKSVVSVLLNYFPGNPIISTKPPKISRYALSVDYHTVIKEMLWQLLDSLRKEFGTINGRAFVDSAPVLERAWAQKSGLGWIGKNSMLINPKIGSYTFLGELIVDADIEPSTNQVPNRCGSCTRCIDACPTGAIISPGNVDGRKCISYLTIEKKSPLTLDEQKSLSGWCFGCDICQEVCPWNSKIEIQTLPSISPKKIVLEINEEELSVISEEKFTKTFSDTPVSRSGYNRFIQNCYGSKA